MGINAQEHAKIILRDLGRQEFEFQACLAARCLNGIESGERLLVVAPTGAGKTLIAQLIVALLARSRDEIPRTLFVLPNRGLAAQHFEDAAWMRDGVPIALHTIYADTPKYQILGLLRSFGVFFTTPVTLFNRLMLPGCREALAAFDCVIFDEIDTHLTVGDQDERKDTYPALNACIEAQLPVIGFTGTGLTPSQLGAWEQRGFQKIQLPIPSEWLPLTCVRFIGVEDGEVIAQDAVIKEELGAAFRSLAMSLYGQPIAIPSFGVVKSLAKSGDYGAMRILGLCAQRLELFESFGSSGRKFSTVVDLARNHSPSLIMSRFRSSANAIKGMLNSEGIHAEVAHGGMLRKDIGSRITSFRNQGANGEMSLIITRDLGGRGLDFPEAASACLFSPRSNQQTVAQELARIRSRQASPKTVSVLYYAETEEEAKAFRLGNSLKTHSYDGNLLFEIEDLPSGMY